MTTLNCFTAYDIRGKLGEELNSEIVYRIGRAYAQLLKPQTVVVGGDVRLTSGELKSAFTSALLDAGVNVIDLGQVGTEEVYFATSFLKADGGCEVTASHNPLNYNGLKMVSAGSRPINGDELKEIKRLAEENQFQNTSQRGKYKQQSTVGEYVEHLLSYVDLKNLKPMKILFNSGNGASGHVIDAIEAQFKALQVPIEFIKMYNNPDGTFPNGIPNPLLHDNRQETVDAVIKNQADFGVAFDGDFDRCFLLDENGGFIEGYYIVGLLAQAFLNKSQGESIIYDPRLIWNTEKIINEHGGKAVVCRSGHTFIKGKMREHNAIYGGEMSAHHYFRDFFYCDSGMIPWLLILELICTTGKKLSELVGESMSNYPSPGEINSKLTDAKKAMARVENHYAPSALKVEKLDGVSIEFADWRFNLRASNTEPFVRLNLETRGDVKLMEEKTAEVLAILRAE